MFFERFDSLAKQKGESVNSVAKELGIASGTVTAWKKGSEPTQSKIVRIAEYFNVSVDYLLGRTDDISANAYDDVDSLKFALYGTDEISDDVFNAVKAFVELQKQQLREQGKL